MKGNPAPRAILKQLWNVILEASRNPILKPLRRAKPRLNVTPKAAWFCFRRRGREQHDRAYAHKG